jgi:serine/threonine protein kinase
VLQKFDRYEIRRELGQGGMSNVYLALDTRFRRLVAVKVLPRQFTHDPRYLDRFEQEAHLIATLEHQAIVPVYDFGEYDDAPFLVMRYMPGGTLRDRLSGEPLPLDMINFVVGRLAPALDRAHELNIIHRDLKPSNILFDEDGNPYLADFGIARLAEASRTVTLVGTPAYMSPEQVEGDLDLDRRADIYAFGVILFELFTGRQPYLANTPTKQMMAHVLEPVPDVLKMNPDLPPGAQEIINKTMAKDREERFNTMGEVAAAINRLAADDQVSNSRAFEPVPIPIVISDPSGEPKEKAENSSIGEGMQEPVDSGGSVPPDKPHDEVGTSQGGFPGWVWWAVAIMALVLISLVMRSIMTVNSRSTTAEPEVPVAVEASQTPLQEETLEARITAAGIVSDATRTRNATTTAEPTATPTAVVTETTVPSRTPTTAVTAEITSTAFVERATPVSEIEVVVGSVNFRTGPGVIYELVEGKPYLLRNDTAKVLGRNSMSSWFNVELSSGVRGWVAASVVNLIQPESISDVPIVATIPVAPTLTPTPTTTSTPVPPTAAPSSSGGGGGSKDTPEPPKPEPPPGPTPG